jgi:hypothetical protein
MTDIDPSGIPARVMAALTATPTTSVGAERLCGACVGVLGVQRAAIAVQIEETGWWEVLGASDTVASRIEGVQATVGDGPGISAAQSRGPVFVADLRETDDRWPLFAAALTTSHTGAMLALPLQIGAIRVGVLDLYFESTAPLDDDEMAAALSAAQLVTTLLLSDGATDGPDMMVGSWWLAPQSSREIHQAAGMVVAQLGVGIRQAYWRLQAYAFAHEQLLTDTAHAVVGRRLRFNPDTQEDGEFD